MTAPLVLAAAYAVDPPAVVQIDADQVFALVLGLGLCVLLLAYIAVVVTRR